MTTTKAVIKRWALWDPYHGFYRPLPRQTEALFDSRRAAVAARLSGSHYEYQPVQVELHFPSEGSK